MKWPFALSRTVRDLDYALDKACETLAECTQEMKDVTELMQVATEELLLCNKRCTVLQGQVKFLQEQLRNN